MTRTPPLLSSPGRVLAAALLCLPALAARWWQAAESAQTLAAPLSTLEIYAISLLVPLIGYPRMLNALAAINEVLKGE